MQKRSLAAIFILFVFLNISSCSKKIEQIGEKPMLEGIDIQEKIDKFDIYIVAASEISSGYLEAAAIEFNKIFDIDLNVRLEFGMDISGIKSTQQVRNTGADGLYLFPYASILRISELAATGDILPLEEYLAENPVWNELPAAMRKMYKSDDGHIWAIPRGFTPVVMGRVFRADYLKELDLSIPNNLDSLYEVSKALAESDPDKNGINDTYGMAYSNAGSFRDIFYANGVPVNTSNDGYQRTSISYNTIYGSFEDSMLMDEMKTTLEYIKGLRETGILRQIRGRYSSGISGFLENNSLANSYVKVPGYVFTDERFAVVSGIRGNQSVNLNPLTYDLADGFYLMGANTEKPGMTINSFVDIMYGDLEGYLFASRGIQGTTYNLNRGTVEVLDKDFFSYSREALLKGNPLYTYETMDIELNTEMANGDILGKIISNATARDLYIEKGKEDEIIFDITIKMAYPEIFLPKPGEIINSAAGAMFDSHFNRILSQRISIDDAIDRYVKDMKRLGMQDIINDLNQKIGAVTRFKY